jgi:hypothetical protein
MDHRMRQNLLAVSLTLVLFVAVGLALLWDQRPRSIGAKPAASPHAANTLPRATTAPIAGSPLARQVAGVFRCTTADGRTLYQDHACSGQTSATPMRGGSFSLVPADQAPPIRPRSAQLAAAPVLPSRTNASTQPPSDECARIDREVTEIDARTRHAHTSATGERLRARRRALRDRQFEIGC